MGFFKNEKEVIVDVQPDRAAYESKMSEHYDGLTRAMNNAKDVAVMRYVLLQFSRWFRSGFKELPFLEADPFVDDLCNCMVGTIYTTCRILQTKKKQTRTRYETGIIG